MKLEKVIIDGQVYYREVVEESKTEAFTEQGPDLGERAGREQERSSAHSEEWFKKVGKGIRDIGDHIVTGVDNLSKKIQTGAERLFSRDKSTDENSTEAKLLKLLPYMDEDGRHDIFLELMENPESLKNVDLGAILPFFTKEDCDALFLCAIDNFKPDNLGELAKFASEDCLSSVVDSYIEGKYQDIDINAIYPYLAQKDIKRLFDYYVSK